MKCIAVLSLCAVLISALPSSIVPEEDVDSPTLPELRNTIETLKEAAHRMDVRLASVNPAATVFATPQAKATEMSLVQVNSQKSPALEFSEISLMAESMRDRHRGISLLGEGYLSDAHKSMDKKASLKDECIPKIEEELTYAKELIEAQVPKVEKCDNPKVSKGSELCFKPNLAGVDDWKKFEEIFDQETKKVTQKINAEKSRMKDTMVVCACTQTLALDTMIKDKLQVILYAVDLYRHASATICSLKKKMSRVKSLRKFLDGLHCSSINEKDRCDRNKKCNWLHRNGKDVCEDKEESTCKGKHDKTNCITHGRCKWNGERCTAGPMQLGVYAKNDMNKVQCKNVDPFDFVASFSWRNFRPMKWYRFLSTKQANRDMCKNMKAFQPSWTFLEKFGTLAHQAKHGGLKCNAHHEADFIDQAKRHLRCAKKGKNSARKVQCDEKSGECGIRHEKGTKTWNLSPPAKGETCGASPEVPDHCFYGMKKEDLAHLTDVDFHTRCQQQCSEDKKCLAYTVNTLSQDKAQKCVFYGGNECPYINFKTTDATALMDKTQAAAKKRREREQSKGGLKKSNEEDLRMTSGVCKEESMSTLFGEAHQTRQEASEKMCSLLDDKACNNDLSCELVGKKCMAKMCSSLDKNVCKEINRCNVVKDYAWARLSESSTPQDNMPNKNPAKCAPKLCKDLSPWECNEEKRRCTYKPDDTVFSGEAVSGQAVSGQQGRRLLQAGSDSAKDAECSSTYYDIFSCNRNVLKNQGINHKCFWNKNRPGEPMCMYDKCGDHGTEGNCNGDCHVSGGACVHDPTRACNGLQLDVCTGNCVSDGGQCQFRDYHPGGNGKQQFDGEQQFDQYYRGTGRCLPKLCKDIKDWQACSENTDSCEWVATKSGPPSNEKGFCRTRTCDMRLEEQQTQKRILVKWTRPTSDASWGLDAIEGAKKSRKRDDCVASTLCTYSTGLCRTKQCHELDMSDCTKFYEMNYAGRMDSSACKPTLFAVADSGGALHSDGTCNDSTGGCSDIKDRTVCNSFSSRCEFDVKRSLCKTRTCSEMSELAKGKHPTGETSGDMFSCARATRCKADSAGKMCVMRKCGSLDDRTCRVDAKYACELKANECKPKNEKCEVIVDAGECQDRGDSCFWKDKKCRDIQCKDLKSEIQCKHVDAAKLCKWADATCSGPPPPPQLENKMLAANLIGKLGVDGRSVAIAAQPLLAGTDTAGSLTEPEAGAATQSEPEASTATELKVEGVQDSAEATEIPDKSVEVLQPEGGTQQ